MKRKALLKSIFLRLTALLLAFLLCGITIACGDEASNATGTDVTTDTDVTPDAPTKDPDVTTKSDVPTDTPVTPDEPAEPTGTDIDVTTSTDVTEPDIPTEPDEPDVPVTPDEPDEPNVPDEPNEPVEPDAPDEPVVPDEPDEPFQTTGITLPAESVTFSTETALSLLPFCNVITKDDFAACFIQNGFIVLRDGHFDKTASDTSHTSAWMLGEGTVTIDGDEKTAYLLVVRATNGGEWSSNFDVLPTRNYDSETADNFAFAALDVLASVSDLLYNADDRVIIVTGHSRGAAVANLIGRELDKNVAVCTDNVYVYTFATPMTVKTTATDIDCPNVFNVIDSADPVTALPLASWGFTRAGRDIVLQAEESLTADVTFAVEKLSTFATDLYDYYERTYTVMESEYALYDAISLYLLPSLSFTDNDATSYTLSPLSFISVYGNCYIIASWLTTLTGINDFVDLANYVTERHNLYTVFSQHLPSTYVRMLTATLY